MSLRLKLAFGMVASLGAAALKVHPLLTLVAWLVGVACGVAALFCFYQRQQDRRKKDRLYPLNKLTGKRPKPVKEETSTI